MTLKDRTPKKVISHRIACGRPAMKNDRSSMASSLDHFEVTFTEADSTTGQFVVDTVATAAVKEMGPAYANMRRVPIRVHSDEIEDFLIQEYQSRAVLPVLDVDGEPRLVDGQPLTQLQVWCHGDGQQAKRRGAKGVDNTIPCCSSPKLFKERAPAELQALLTRQAKHDPHDGKRCPFAQNNNARVAPLCKPSTLLICRSDVIANLGAFARYRSTGHATADELRSSFEDIKAMLGGVLANVPLDLVCSPRKITGPNGKGRIQPVVHVELRLSMEQTVRVVEENLRARTQMLATHREAKGLLAAAVHEDSHDESVGREFNLVADGNKPSGNLPVLEADEVKP